MQFSKKVEKQRNNLNNELAELSERLDEAGGATAAQMDLNKKREMELTKLRRDMEQQALVAEQQVSQLRKKMQDATNELTDQVDSLSKIKAKLVDMQAKLQPTYRWVLCL